MKDIFQFAYGLIRWLMIILIAWAAVLSAIRGIIFLFQFFF